MEQGEMRDRPEWLKELISDWENGEISEEMLSALARAGREADHGMRKTAKGPRKVLMGVPGTSYAKKKIPVDPVQADTEAPDHHSLHEQREELHDIFLGIRMQADNAREILTVLDGFIAGGYEGGIKECDAKEASIAHDMPMIIRGLRAQEAVLARTLAGIRCAVDGRQDAEDESPGPSPEGGYDARKYKAED